MRIVNAAIRFEEFKDGNRRHDFPENRRQRVLRGYSHSDIEASIGAMDIVADLYSYEYGFMTDNGEFINRIEAMKIAREAGQLKDYYKKNSIIQELKSYMLNYYTK